MTDISKISNGTNTYNIKDTEARTGLSNKQDTLVSGTNIKTINNESILGSGNISTSTPIDNVTITENSSNQIQATCILNKNNNTVLPIWEGTEYEWEHYQSTTWYYWKTNETALWSSSGTLTNGYWYDCEFGENSLIVACWNPYKLARSTDGGETWTELALKNGDYNPTLAYGGGNWVCVTASTSAYYSTDDGETWNTATLPSSHNWMKPCYGNGRFVAVSTSTFSQSSAAAYSTDGGETWNASTLPTSAGWGIPCYCGNNTFVVIADDGNKESNAAAYSTDGGETWNSATLPTSAYWCTLTYGNGVLIAGTKNTTNKLARSVDNGETWEEITMPSSSPWMCITYIGNRFIALNYNGKCAYSDDDGETWNEVTIQNRIRFHRLGYSNGILLAISIDGTSSKSFYSTDRGITWTSYNFQTKLDTGYFQYNHYVPSKNGKFILSYGGSQTSVGIFSVSFRSCYTLDSSPSIESNTYSAPEVAYQYEIQSVSSGSIILSDNNTYYYDSNGNTSTYRNLGYIEPTWLCNIKGVGVKIGNDIIAEKNKPLDSFITFPSSVAGQSITLGASGTTYTAPKNGYYSLSATFSTDGILYMYRGSGARYGISIPYSANQWVDSYLPMKQGEILIIQYNGTATVQQFTFIYAE